MNGRVGSRLSSDASADHEPSETNGSSASYTGSAGSADVALRLERVTGTPARIWNRREADYRSDQERIRSERELSGDVMWVDDG